MLKYSVALFILLASLGLSQAVVIRPGQCRELDVHLDFNLTEYLGTWYEIQRYEMVFQQDMECVTATYELPDPAVAQINVINRGAIFNETVFERFENVGIAIPSFPEDPRNPAMLNVAFFGAPLDRSNYWVLGTDYHSYSLVYSCEQITPDSYMEFSWVLSRTRTTDEAFWTVIDTLIWLNDINTDDFRVTNQSPAICSGPTPF